MKSLAEMNTAEREVYFEKLRNQRGMEKEEFALLMTRYLPAAIEGFQGSFRGPQGDPLAALQKIREILDKLDALLREDRTIARWAEKRQQQEREAAERSQVVPESAWERKFRAAEAERLAQLKADLTKLCD